MSRFDIIRLNGLRAFAPGGIKAAFHELSTRCERPPSAATTPSPPRSTQLENMRLSERFAQPCATFTESTKSLLSNLSHESSCQKDQSARRQTWSRRSRSRSKGDRARVA